MRPSTPADNSNDYDADDERDSDDDENVDINSETDKVKKIKLSPCKKNEVRACHRYNLKSIKWRNVTEGYLSVYFGIICILGATKLRSASLMYQKDYGTNLPYVQNACVEQAFKQIRRYIHFVDTSRLLKIIIHAGILCKKYKPPLM